MAPQDPFEEALSAVRSGSSAPAPSAAPADPFESALTAVRQPIEAGNVDLFAQPAVPNPDGSISTVDSRSYGVTLPDGRKAEILLPSVTPDGRHLTSDDDVFREYEKTGRHLGVFPSPEAATAYAVQLHEDYAAGKYTPSTPMRQRGAMRPPVMSAQVADMTPATITDFEPPPTIDPRTGARVTPVPFGKLPIVDAPAGIAKAARGAVGIAKALGSAAQAGPEAVSAPQEPVAPSGSPLVSQDAMKAGNELIEGVFQAAEPMIAAGLVANFPATAWALMRATIVAKFGEGAAEALDASPEAQRLAGNIGAALSGSGSLRDVVKGNLSDAARVMAAAAKAKGRVLALAAKIGSPGYGAGDVPGYRGAPTTDIVASRPAESPPSARTKAIEESIRSGGRTVAETQETQPPPARPDVQDAARAAEAQPVIEPRGPYGSKIPPPPVTQMDQAGPEFQKIEPSVPPPPELTDPFDQALDQVKEDQDTPAVVDRKYSSTQLNLPEPVAQKLQAVAESIPEDQLAEGGRETEPHVTVKYGLHTTDAEAVRRVLADQPPITVTLGKLSVFPDRGQGDVLKADVDSPALRALNATIAEALEATDSFPDYQPHATIAYLKPGVAASYVGRDDVEGETVTIDQVAFTTPTGERVMIALAGAAAAEPRDDQPPDAPTNEVPTGWTADLPADVRKGSPFGIRGPAGEKRQPGSIGAVPTERGWVGSVMAPGDRVLYTERAYQFSDQASAAAAQIVDAQRWPILDNNGRALAPGDEDYRARIAELAAHATPVQDLTDAQLEDRLKRTAGEFRREAYQEQQRRETAQQPTAVADEFENALEQIRESGQVADQDTTAALTPEREQAILTEMVKFLRAFRRRLSGGESDPDLKQIEDEAFARSEAMTKDLSKAERDRLETRAEQMVDEEDGPETFGTDKDAEDDETSTRPEPAKPPATKTTGKAKAAKPPTGTPQQVYQQFKRALAKALNAKDWPAVIAEADRFTAYYDDPANPPYPDDWHRWERARDDAQLAIQRQESGLEPITRPLAPTTKEPDEQPEEGVESSHGDETPGDGLDAEELPARGGRTTRPDRAGSEGPLEAASSDAVPPARSEGPEQPGHGDPEGVLAGGVRRAPDAGDESVDVAAPGGTPDLATGPVSPSGTVDDPGPVALDYTLTAERIARIINRGSVARAKDNLAAIKLVRELEAEDRFATEDEQETLARYVGWGDSAVAQYLRSDDKPDWSKPEKALAAELREILTEAERDALVDSTLNAHFSFDLYRPIWEALQEAGFTGGRVLEPAVGVGHAFGFMPPDLRAASTLNATELDPLTAKIAGYLYPSATVQAIGYEKSRIPRDTQDLVISNVPFGKYRVNDPLMQPAILTESVHNYFFAKAIEHARQGGLVVFVTSRYTMDGTVTGPDNNVSMREVRAALIDKANFLGALRLPNTAFDKSAKTEVVTDLIVLQKRDPSETASKESALFLDTQDHPELSARRNAKGKALGKIINQSLWYAEHPEYILGKESLEGSMYGGGEYTVTAPREGIQDAIRKGLKALIPDGTFVPIAHRPRPPRPTPKMAEGIYKPGELRAGDTKGRIVRVAVDGEMTDVTPVGKDGKPAPKSVARILGQIGIRDALRETVARMSDPDASDAYIKEAQRKLTKVYQAFVAKWGELNRPVNKRLFAQDPESPNLLGLEQVEMRAVTEVDKKTGAKSVKVRYVVTGLNDIFTKRTIRAPREIAEVETPKDALMASLGSSATVDWAYMSRIAGQTPKQLQAALTEEGLVFEQPDGSYVIAEEYLSGDVVKKLEDAKDALAQKGGKRFERNVAALEPIVPTPKTRDDIVAGVVDLQLGAHWIDPKDLAGFIRQELSLGDSSPVAVRLEGGTSFVRWIIGTSREADYAASQHELAVPYAQGRSYSWMELLLDTLNMKMPDLGHFEGAGKGRVYVREPEATLAARANQERLRASWRSYVLEHDALQDRALDIFNTRFNRMVERTFDGSHLTFPGKSETIDFFPHQSRAIWRILTTGNTLLAHEVGAGKTFEMIAAAMEMRRTGRARKPMITVPTYLLGQWTRDIMMLYPKAKLAAFDAKDLDAQKRQAAMARIAFGDWDIVLVPHSSFGLLKVSEDRLADMMQRWINELKALEKTSPDPKKIAAQRKKLEAKAQRKIDKLNQSETDNALTWEQLGVDALFIDEAHVFKNLFFFSKIENMRGLSRSESDRALQLYVKVQDINEQSRHRNLVLATATPVMNSMAEAFTMQRYLQPQALRRYGVENFDNWYAMFAKAAPNTERQPDGTYKEVMRLKAFSNLQLLSKMLREVMDYVGWEDMPYLQLPKLKGGKININQIQPHPLFPKLQEWFTKRMDNIRQMPPRYDHRKLEYIAPQRPDPLTGRPTADQDNILTIMNDAKKVAIDVRLVLGDRATDYPQSRVQIAAEKMVRIYREEAPRKGVQLVFLDYGTPKEPPPLEFLTGVELEDTTEGEAVDEEDVVDEPGEGDPVIEDDAVFNLYDALKKELVKRGVPSREIAYIHSAKNAAQRLALFNAANEGTVRFVFASTDKGGVGMNIQRNLAAMHEIDAPRMQRPGDLRQRMGRIIRQKNSYDEVALHRYVTQDTTDEWLWGLITLKDMQIRQFLKGELSSMVDEDPSTMSLEEAQIRASGDPRGIELTTLRGKLARLEAQALSAERAISKAHYDKRTWTDAKRNIERDLAQLRAWLERDYVADLSEHFAITLGRQTYTKRADATTALRSMAAKMEGAEYRPIGTIGGLKLEAKPDTYNQWVKDTLVKTPSVTIRMDGAPYGGGKFHVVDLFAADPKDLSTLGEGQQPITVILNAYRDLPKRVIGLEQEREDAGKRIEAADRLLGKPSSVIDEHKAAVARIEAIEQELRLEGVAAERQRDQATKAKDQAKPDDQDQVDDDGTTGGDAGMPSGGSSIPKRPPVPGGASRVALPVDAIIAKLSALFDGVPVSVGHYHGKTRFRAIYKPAAQTVRAKQANDLYAVAHEFGHHIDLALMHGSPIHKRGAIAKELKTLGAPTSLPSYTPAQQRQEGAAEFFRIWLLEPERLPVEAPLYLAQFDQFLQRNHELSTGLLEIRDDVQHYLSLGGRKQAELHIDYTGGSGAIVARFKRLREAAQTVEGRRSAITYLSSHWMDDLAALNAAERAIADGRPYDITDSGYALARIARGAPSKAEGFLKYGVRDRNGQFIGPSYDDILTKIGDRLEEFDLYRTAVHAREMHEHGIESGLTRTQIAETIEELQSPAFDDALEQMRDWYHGMRRYMLDAGLIDGQQIKAMERRWRDYVPMQRVMEAAEGAFSGALSRKSVANQRSPVKRLKGSARRVIRPMESDIRNTHAAVEAGEKNRAMLAFVRHALKHQGHGALIEEIPQPQVPTIFNLQSIQDTIVAELERQGVDLPTNLELDETATIWTPRMFAKGSERFVTVVDEGKIRWFEVHDHGLYEALSAIGPEGSQAILTWFQLGTSTLRKFAVTTLGFVLARNPPRDIMTAMAASRAGFTPLDFLRGLFSALKQDEDFQLFVHSGAANATLVGRDRDELRRRLRDLSEPQRLKWMRRTILHPLEALQAVSQILEHATRVGEFKATLRKLGRDEAALVQAGLNARDVTQDFSKMGRQVRQWNRMVAFFGARVGGYGRLYQMLREGGGGGKGTTPPPPGGPPGGATGGFGDYGSHGAPGPMGFLWKATASISLLSLALWVLNHDDEDYQQIPAWERNAYWHLRWPDELGGGFVRMPKPFELGQIFGTSIETALDWLVDRNPDMKDRLPDKGTAQQLILYVLPTLVLPWVQVAANYDFFRDRAIVNPYDIDLKPELQYSRWTTESAKKLGAWLHLSPAKIEALVYGYTAGVGRGVLQAVDAAVGTDKPRSGPAFWPLVGAFYRGRPSGDAQVLTSFFEARDQLNGVKGSIRRYEQAGEREKAEAMRQEHEALLRNQGAIQHADRAIQGQRKRVTRVFEDPRPTPAQKQKQLDDIYQAMQQIAGRALGRR